ncbi:MAG TPA: RNA-binding protein [Candidatus Binatia bacterium]|jgi:hypothetical protein|nr:RNA-binding protein [Candidatus Binatia bacterium]
MTTTLLLCNLPHLVTYVEIFRLFRETMYEPVGMMVYPHTGIAFVDIEHADYCQTLLDQALLLGRKISVLPLTEAVE